MISLDFTQVEWLRSLDFTHAIAEGIRSVACHAATSHARAPPHAPHAVSLAKAHSPRVAHTHSALIHAAAHLTCSCGV